MLLNEDLDPATKSEEGSKRARRKVTMKRLLMIQCLCLEEMVYLL